MSQLSVPVLARGPFHNAPSTVATTILIRASEDEPAHKVTKLMGYKQGGFALLSPYHSARTGVLTKMLMDYRRGTAAIDVQETETFSASDRVKLSYHMDGFVQFSGERAGRVVSGRDPVTREPKGLGIMTNPMGAPVMTGPAFGITVWGLGDFEEQKGKPRGDALTFGPEDFVYDHCDESNWGSYGIEFFIFGVYFQPYVRQIGRTQFEMPMWHNQYHNQGRQFIYKVVRLGRQPFFLGALCFRRPAVEFDASSGWSIGSPGALAKGPIKPMLHAFYPADGWPEPTATIDYGSWQQSNPGSAAEPQFERDYGAVIERAE